MEERTKQRLVGGLVLVGGLFIILPFLFHNSRPSAVLLDDADNVQTSQTLTLPAQTPAISSDNTENVNTATTTAASSSNLSAANAMPTSSAPVLDASSPTTDISQTAVNQAVTVESPAPSIITNATDSTAPAPVTAAVAAPVSPQIATTTAAPVLSSNGLTTGEPAVQPSLIQTAAAAQMSTTAPAGNDESQTMPVVTEAAETSDQSQTTIAANDTDTDIALAAVSHQAKLAAIARSTHKTSPVEIQMGVFSQSSNAKHLLAKLHAEHYTAYARTISRDGRTLTGVYVAETNLSRAKVAQQKLHRELALNGNIVKS